MALESVESLLVRQQNNALWELFHENSKMGRHDRHPMYKLWPSDAKIVQVMKRLRSVKPYTDFQKLPLPEEVPDSKKSFDSVLTSRRTARQFSGEAIRLEQLAKVLFMSYGITRDNTGTHFPRPFRTIPSGGALYPLEIYLHATRVDGLAPGLYHYDPEDNTLDVLRRGDESSQVAGLLVQSDLALNAAAILFVSVVFLRTVFKYGSRGYRFILLEAGHLAQNANLTAQEMELAMTNIGGYMDREVDRYLRLDGVNESTVYVLLIGQPVPDDLEADTGQWA